MRKSLLLFAYCATVNAVAECGARGIQMTLSEKDADQSTKVSLQEILDLFDRGLLSRAYVIVQDINGVISEHDFRLAEADLS